MWISERSSQMERPQRNNKTIPENRKPSRKKSRERLLEGLVRQTNENKQPRLVVDASNDELTINGFRGSNMPIRQGQTNLQRY